MEKKIFEDLEKHLLNDEKPSEYIRKTIYKFKGTSLEVLIDLEKIEQSKKYHPEGNVLNHTLLVVDAAASIREHANNKKALMWAAIFHDLGKITTTKIRNGRITSYEHDTTGSKDVEKILRKYDFEEVLENKVKSMVRYHMHHLYISKDLPFANTEKMLEDVDLNDMALLFYSDKLGRGEMSKVDKAKAANDVVMILEKLDEKYDVDIKKTIENFKDIIKDGTV